MPKLQGIEDKYINGIKVDKENKDVFFNDETHKYYDKKTMQPYISVTQIVGKYSQEFDENFWSSYKALEAILEGDVFSIIKPSLSFSFRKMWYSLLLPIPCKWYGLEKDRPYSLILLKSSLIKLNLIL